MSRLYLMLLEKGNVPELPYLGLCILRRAQTFKYSPVRYRPRYTSSSKLPTLRRKHIKEPIELPNY